MNKDLFIRYNKMIRIQRRLAKIRRPMRLDPPKESIEKYEPSRTKHYRNNINVIKRSQGVNKRRFRYKHQRGSIPQGIYCYDGAHVCPYWRLDRSKIPQNGGICLYLSMKDRDSLDLLWDMVKACRLNDEYIPYDE